MCKLRGRQGRFLGAAALLALLALLALGGGATAQTNQKLMQTLGGVYAPDCSSYLLPQLKFLGDTLVVQDQGRALLTGRKVRPAPAGAFGPTGLVAALTSEVAPGESMDFVFTRDASGLYVTVDGNPRVMQTLPAALHGKRIRHCDPNRNAAPGGVPAAPPNPWDLLQDPAFKQAYLRALGPLASESWLARLSGPASPVRTLQLAGTDYELAAVCKPHDCCEHNLVLLWAPGTRSVYGRVVQGARVTLIGAPPPPLAAELERLWQAEYRR
ncbi:MAG TPA: Ivy family c-type lysozyme inhibitor [Rubrivivax sp.]|nr:Ivy family c-type lysozyme inhibitor [Rubrivivax sp.]